MAKNSTTDPSDSPTPEPKAKGATKVATEVCESEFERFADAMDLDLDPQGMDDEDRDSFKAAKRVVMRAMERGTLVINDAGEPVFTPVHPKSGASAITFHEPTGGVLMATDHKKKGHDMAKLYAAMGEQTGELAKRFATMPQRDLRVCQAVFMIFIG